MLNHYHDHQFNIIRKKYLLIYIYLGQKKYLFMEPSIHKTSKSMLQALDTVLYEPI